MAQFDYVMQSRKFVILLKRSELSVLLLSATNPGLRAAFVGNDAPEGRSREINIEIERVSRFNWSSWRESRL